MFRSVRQAFIAGIAAWALILTALGAGTSVSAQEGEDAFTLGIVGVNCDIQAPQNIAVAEEGCSPAESVTFTATILNGDAVGSCAAQIADVENPITAGCSIDIPYGATVVVNEDPTTVPAGYQIMQNAQEYTAPDGPVDGPVGGVIFVNLLQDDTTTPEPEDNASTDEDAPASDQPVRGEDLPKTGTGLQQAVNHGGLAAVASSFAIIAAAGGVVLRTGIRKQ